MRNLKVITAIASLATMGALLVGCGTSGTISTSTNGGTPAQQNTGSGQTSTPTQSQPSTQPTTSQDSSQSSNGSAPSSSNGNSSSTPSTSSQGTTPAPTPAPAPNQPGGWITVTSPQSGTSAKPGMAMPIAGKVAEPSFWNKTLHVTLFSGTADTKQTNRILHEQDFTIASDGTFQGTFQLPNSAFNGGSAFQMVFQADAPHAPTYYLTLTP